MDGMLPQAEELGRRVAVQTNDTAMDPKPTVTIRSQLEGQSRRKSTGARVVGIGRRVLATMVIVRS